MKWALWTAVFGILAGCSGISMNRSFISQMDRESDPLFVPGQDFRLTPGDTGKAYRGRREILRRTPMSIREGNQQDDPSLYKELYDKESRLNQAEETRYRHVRSYFESPSEKIYYLSLPPRERESYLLSKGIERDEWGPQYLKEAMNPQNMDFLAPSGLSVGMSKGEVLTQWGRPERIDVSGHPQNENERWTFYQSGRSRRVYFESGFVEGWETE